jgi:hypothetical protein
MASLNLIKIFFATCVENSKAIKSPMELLHAGKIV